MDDKEQKEKLIFLKFLSEIHNSCSYINLSDNKKLILIVNIDLQNDSAEFTCYTEDVIWICKFKMKDFENYKKKMGFEGSWESFFISLKCALNKIKGGIFSAIIPKNKKDPLIIKISHPLSEGLKISGDLEFTNAEVIDSCSIDFNERAFNISLKLVDLKDTNIKTTEVNVSKTITSYYTPSSFSSSNNSINTNNLLDKNKNLKRKYNGANLVNPGQKRSKNRGATFIVEDDDDENNKYNENNEES